MDYQIKFNKVYDQPPDLIQFVPGRYAKWWVSIAFVLVLIYITLASMMEVPLWYWVTLPVLMISHAILIGNKEHVFLSGFHEPETYIVAKPTENRTRTKLKPQIGTLTVGVTQKRKVTPIEDRVQLVAPVRFNLRGFDIGAYLLEDGKDYRLVFVFESTGIASTISNEDALRMAEKLQRGLADFQGLEMLTMRYGTFADCSDRIRDLQELMDNAPNEQSKFLLHWQMARVKRLTELGRHNPKSLRFFYTYTLKDGTGSTGNNVQDILVKMQTMFKRREQEKNIHAQLEGILRQSFSQGFLKSLRFLNKLGLEVTPLNHEEVWSVAWRQINHGEAPPIPELIILNQQGLDWERHSNITSYSTLFQKGEPIPDKKWIYLPGRDEYVGSAVLVNRPKLEWDGKTERLDQLQFAVAALNEESTVNTEIVVQFTSADQEHALRQVTNNTKDANRSRNIAGKKSKVDLGAEYNLEQSADSQMALRRGGVVIKLAWVALIYRSTPDLLDDGIDDFCSHQTFNGEVVQRETGYADQIWFETLPFVWRKMLTAGGFAGMFSANKFERRVTETTPAALAFTPFLMDKSKAKRGLEFISPNGRTPIYLDPFGSRPHNHTIISGFTGSGKSVLIEATAEYALALDAKVCFIDADKGNNTSTYEEFIKFAGGDYFDPKQERSNIFEGTDQRQMEKGTERSEAGDLLFRDFLVNGLRELALPREIDSTTARTAKDSLSLLVDSFLKDPEMRRRRDLAFDDGLGKGAWEQFPTLRDFIPYMIFDHLPLSMRTETVAAILSTMAGSLAALCCRTSGEAIASPSTFRKDSKLTVYTLGQFGDDDDSLPMLLSAQANVISGAFGVNKTAFIQDEASMAIARFNSVGAFNADIFAKGRALGIWATLLGQDINPIIASEYGTQIFQNTETFVTGYIKTDAVEGLVSKGIPRELLKQNVDTNFFLPQHECARRWLISQGTKHMFGDYYPSFASLALTMNEEEEVTLKQQIEAENPGNKYLQIAAIAKTLKSRSIDAKR